MRGRGARARAGAEGSARCGAGAPAGAWNALLERAVGGGVSSAGGRTGRLERVRPEQAPGGGAWGLRAAAPAEKGAVLLSVPFRACLACQRGVGSSGQAASGPPPGTRRYGEWGAGPWRWALEGEAVPGLPWDLQLALALVDLSEQPQRGAVSTPSSGGAGKCLDAGAFVGDYLRHWAPPEDELVLPFCLPEALVHEFQHSALEGGALEQQRRLAGTFPELMPGPDGTLPDIAQSSAPLPSLDGWWAAPGAPGPLQAGFALVRSRAFQMAEDTFAYVPFLDMANHALEPSADFMTTQEEFVLFARQDLAEGDAVTISYGAHTNQRLMTQYGFVPEGGNPHDRLDLLTDLQFGGGFRGFPLERVQAAVGDVPFLLALEGRDPRLTATLKSLPLCNDDEETAGSNGGAGVAGDGNEEWGEAQRGLAFALQQRCQQALASCPTSMEEDLALLGARVPASRGLETALRYRIERKQLILRSAGVLGTLAAT